MDAMLPGLKGMLNSHPVFVHFPIAFLLGALLFELLAVARSNDELHRTAVRLLWLGTLAAFAAVGTGLLAAESVPEVGPADQIKDIHEYLMIASTSLAAGLSAVAFFLRNNFTASRRKLLLLGLVVLAGLLTAGADRGVQLVFQYGTAVNWSTAQPQK